MGDIPEVRGHNFTREAIILTIDHVAIALHIIILQDTVSHNFNQINKRYILSGNNKFNKLVTHCFLGAAGVLFCRATSVCMDNTNRMIIDHLSHLYASHEGVQWVVLVL